MAKTENEELTALLRADEQGVRAWFKERQLDLLHECACGYTTYDDEHVSEEVQGVFGDRRATEISEWAMNLSNRFGWMDEVGSADDGIHFYYCQHCDPSRPE